MHHKLRMVPMGFRPREKSFNQRNVNCTWTFGLKNIPLTRPMTLCLAIKARQSAPTLYCQTRPASQGCRDTMLLAGHRQSQWLRPTTTTRSFLVARIQIPPHYGFRDACTVQATPWLKSWVGGQGAFPQNPDAILIQNRHTWIKLASTSKHDCVQ